MQKDTIVLMADYNAKANEAMNGIIKTLSQAEWEKPLGGYFSSVRSLCSHIYIGDFNWLKRFGNLRPFVSLKDPFFDKSLSFSETLFEGMGEYLAERPGLDKRLQVFADELTDADLDRVLTYTDSHGVQMKKNSGGCALHFFNHQTHHRGMISFCLEILGRANDFNSLVQVVK